MPSIRLTEADEGKRLVSQSGDDIGVITEVRDGTAHVDPNPDVIDSIKSKLGWGDKDEDTYPVSGDDVAEVTQDKVRLS